MTNGRGVQREWSAALHAGFGWTEGVPRFACRWTIKANSHDLQWCTTIFDLLPDRTHVAVYPGAVSRCAVRLDRSGIDMLADAPPYRGPMELALELPRDTGIRVLFFNERVPLLADTLAEIQLALA